MSDILIELIGLVIEVIIDVAADVATSKSKGAKNTIKSKPIQKQKRYLNIHKDTEFDNSLETPVLFNGNSSVNKPEFSSDSKNEKIVFQQTDMIPMYNTQANQVKLEILLLSYMFKEDDGRISGSEKRAIKKHFSNFKGVLKEEDINEIKKFDSLDKSLINIRAFISQNHVTEGDISDAIKTLKNIERDSDRYRAVISRIESSLLEAMGY